VKILIEELHIIDYIKRQTARKIILFILKNGQCTFKEVVEHLRMAPSTVSWHLKRLVKDEVIQSTCNGKNCSYDIGNVNTIYSTIDKCTNTNNKN
jgi:predicted transcriptional regulator